MLPVDFIQKKVSILITTTQETISETVEQEKKVLRTQKFHPELSSYSRGGRENISIKIVLSLLLASLMVL